VLGQRLKVSCSSVNTLFSGVLYCNSEGGRLQRSQP
jgi:hypothetical protein